METDVFFGREYEMKALNDTYESDKFQFYTIRGRRRVGKSKLLKEFCKGKNHIYFAAQQQSKKDSLIKLSAVVQNFFGKEGYATYSNFEKLFEDVFVASQKEKMVFVIDELPYLVDSDKSIMSILQNLIDKYHNTSKMFLILCGSSISFMENKVLSYKAPLYGRSTGGLKIEPFFFQTATEYFPNYSNIDKVIAYSVFGGIPAYLEVINNKKNVKENIINSFLEKKSFIYEEPSTLLKEEFREPAIYNSIIEAIATGSSKLNQISTKIDDTNGSKTANYLKKLIELKLIIKEAPITEKKNSKRTIYRISDNLYKFWYKFVFPNLSVIEFGNAEILYNELVLPYMPDYIGFTFENICMEYLLLNINNREKVPFFFHQIGRWWGTNPKTRSEEEIDLMAFTNDKKHTLLVECKWRNEKTGLSVLNDLIRKSELLNKYEGKQYALFSKSGFNKELTDYAKTRDDVFLYDLDDVCYTKKYKA
jgi:AAA+ ATPase superfamily predicted ATPase